jgi:hypothetical protein
VRSVVRIYPGPLPLANSQRKSEALISKFENWNFELVSDLVFRISREAGPGDVAQLGERRLCKPEVAGSSPVVSIELIGG